jgi:hypothetical protein
MKSKEGGVKDEREEDRCGWRRHDDPERQFTTLAY